MRIRGMSVQKEFNNAVLLDMLRCGCQPEEIKGSVFVRRELDIVDLNAVYRRLAKKGLCAADGSGSYTLTDAGQTYLDAREDLVRFFYFASPYITIGEYRRARDEQADASFEDVMLDLSARKLGKYLDERSYQNAEDVMFDIGCLYEMTGQLDEAFVRYAAALFMAARGVEYTALIEDVRAGRTDRELARRSYAGVNFQPKVIDGLRRLKDQHRPETTGRALKLAAVPPYLSTDDQLRQLLYNILHDRYVYSIRQATLARSFMRALQVGE